MTETAKYLPETDRFSLGPGRPIPYVGDLVRVQSWSITSAIEVTEVFPRPTDGFQYVFRGIWRGRPLEGTDRFTGVDRVNLGGSLTWSILRPEPVLDVALSLPLSQARAIRDFCQAEEDLCRQGLRYGAPGVTPALRTLGDSLDYALGSQDPS